MIDSFDEKNYNKEIKDLVEIEDTGIELFANRFKEKAEALTKKAKKSGYSEIETAVASFVSQFSQQIENEVSDYAKKKKANSAKLEVLLKEQARNKNADAQKAIADLIAEIRDAQKSTELKLSEFAQEANLEVANLEIKLTEDLNLTNSKVVRQLIRNERKSAVNEWLSLRQDSKSDRAEELTGLKRQLDVLNQTTGNEELKASLLKAIAAGQSFQYKEFEKLKESVEDGVKSLESELLKNTLKRAKKERKVKGPLEKLVGKALSSAGQATKRAYYSQADRLGVGPLTLGNATRLLGSVTKGSFRATKATYGLAQALSYSLKARSLEKSSAVPQAVQALGGNNAKGAPLTSPERIDPLQAEKPKVLAASKREQSADNQPYKKTLSIRELLTPRESQERAVTPVSKKVRQALANTPKAETQAKKTYLAPRDLSPPRAATQVKQSATKTSPASIDLSLPKVKQSATRGTLEEMSEDAQRREEVQALQRIAKSLERGDKKDFNLSGMLSKILGLVTGGGILGALLSKLKGLIPGLPKGLIPPIKPKGLPPVKKNVPKTFLGRVFPKVGKALRGIPGLGLGILGATEYFSQKSIEDDETLNAEEKKKASNRSLAESVGAAVGGTLGGGVGLLAGPVGAVGGGIAGSVAGAKAGEKIYDFFSEEKDPASKELGALEKKPAPSGKYAHVQNPNSKVVPRPGQQGPNSSTRQGTPKGAERPGFREVFRFASPRVDVKGLNPTVKSNLEEMGRQYYEATGKKLQINSAYRSREHQMALHRQDPNRAAPPGRSLHEYGLAVDLQPNQVDELQKMGLLSKFGFERIAGNNERQHIQVKGARDPATRAGLISGDFVPQSYVKPTPQSLSAPQPKPSINSDSSEVVPVTIADEVSKANTAKTPVQAVAENKTPSGARTTKKSTSQQTKISVGNFPTFAYNDGSFFAMNLGAIS